MEKIEVCNVWKCECSVNIKTSEKLCPFCKGQGGKFVNASFKQKYFTVRQCILCRGEGKVDWIKAITKKMEPYLSPAGYHATLKAKEIKMKCTGPQNCKKRLLRIWRQREDKNIVKFFEF
jgi:DnaJ-class molecular chaperone